MMINGICPLCGAAEVYHGLCSEGEGLAAGSYTLSIEVLAEKQQSVLYVDTYICQACGYIEMRVANREALPVLSQADGWIKVPPKPNPGT